MFKKKFVMIILSVFTICLLSPYIELVAGANDNGHAIILAKGHNHKHTFKFIEADCRATANAGFTHVSVDYSTFNQTQFNMLKRAGLLPIIDFTGILLTTDVEKNAVKKAIRDNNIRQGSVKTRFLVSGTAVDKKTYALMDRWNNFVKSIPNSISYIMIRPNEHREAFRTSRLVPHVTNFDFIGVNDTNKDPFIKSKSSYDGLITKGGRAPEDVFFGEWIYANYTKTRENRTALVSGTRTLWYWVDGHIDDIFRGSGRFSGMTSTITKINTFAKGLFETTAQSTFSGPQTGTAYVDECARFDAAPGKSLTVSKIIWYRSSASPRYFFLVYNPSSEAVNYKVRFRYRLKDKAQFRIMAVQGKGIPRTAYKKAATIESGSLTLWRVAYIR